MKPPKDTPSATKWMRLAAFARRPLDRARPPDLDPGDVPKGYVPQVADEDDAPNRRASGCSQPQLRPPLVASIMGPRGPFMIGLHGRPKKASSECCVIGT